MVRQGQGRSSTWSSTTASHTPHRRFSLAAYVSFVADFSFTRSLSWHAFATSNSSNLECGTFPRVSRMGLRQLTTLVLEHSETWSHWSHCKTSLQVKTYTTGDMEMTKKTKPQCVL